MKNINLHGMRRYSIMRKFDLWLCVAAHVHGDVIHDANSRSVDARLPTSVVCRLVRDALTIALRK